MTQNFLIQIDSYLNTRRQRKMYMAIARNGIKSLLMVFCFFALMPIARAQFYASSSTSGPASSMNFSVVISPQPEFVGNGSSIWFAVVQRGVIYFLRENDGFTRYNGGSAPAFRAISSATETITLNNWNTLSNAGDDVFIGVGSSFQDMADNLRFVHVHTFQQLQPTTFSLTPTSLIFDSQGTHTTSNGKQVILKNTGSTALQVRSITATNGFTSTDNCESIIQPNGTCVIGVTFTPGLVGVINGSLTIDSVNASKYTMLLVGTGVYSPPRTTCSISATATTITLGSTVTLTASCSPTTPRIRWGGLGCVGVQGNVCITSPATTTTYFATDDSIDNTICEIEASITGEGKCSIPGRVTITVR